MIGVDLFKLTNMLVLEFFLFSNTVHYKNAIFLVCCQKLWIAKALHIFLQQKYCISGPGCSKLTTSLVNVSLNFQNLISQICQYFLLKKCEKLLSFFSTKNISVFGYKAVKHVKS